jgi:uncharacterized coiled-coil protein SlyX
MAHKSIRLSIKNERIVALEERQGLLERLFNEKLSHLETEVGKLSGQQEVLFEKMEDFQKNELAHVAQAAVDIKELKVDFREHCKSNQEEIKALEKIIYKAIGAIGATLAILEIALKFLK